MSGTSSTRETSQYVVTVAFNTNDDHENEKRLLDIVLRTGLCAAVIVMFLMILALVVKLLWDSDGHEQGARANETTRLLSPTEKIVFSFYGSSSDTDLESGKTSPSNSSSDDLYDEKICVICYDDQRSCLFVPCGHCITCYTCAKRIIKDEIKSCPICRTLIHKVRRLQIGADGEGCR